MTLSGFCQVSATVIKPWTLVAKVFQGTPQPKRTPIPVPNSAFLIGNTLCYLGNTFCYPIQGEVNNRTENMKKLTAKASSAPLPYVNFPSSSRVIGSSRGSPEIFRLVQHLTGFVAPYI